MQPDIIPLIAGLIIFVSSLISLKLGLSVAVIEISIGVIAGNLGLRAEEWMVYFAGFGGIVLTFLAGAEVDAKLFREKFKESFLIGFFSFLAPFVCAFLFAYFVAGWSLPASLIAGSRFPKPLSRLFIPFFRKQAFPETPPGASSWPRPS